MEMKNKYVNQTLTELSKLIIGGLTFVSALAWNEAFKEYFSNNTYLKDKGLWIYAVITSLIAVIMIIFINNVSKLLKTTVVVIFIVVASMLYYKFYEKNPLKEQSSSK
jgi:Mn2+/Fe2+ NRAMP family transporter